MTYVTEFDIDSPLLRRTSTAVPKMTMRSEDIVLREEGPPKFLFMANGGSFDEFESALSIDPTVARFTQFGSMGDKCHYSVIFTERAHSKATYRVASAHDIAFLNGTLQNGTFSIRARVPDKDSLSAYRDFCDREDIPFRLRQLYRETSPTAVEYGLTDRQREALTLAYERGYFDSPRTEKLEDIAAELDISRQAMADRLRRGHKHLIAATID